jgi:membrane associated rhomboid family serine protease
VGYWGVSGAALAAGRYETITLHMISHGSIMHVLMNVAALLAIGPRLAMRLGRAPLAGCGSCCCS